MESYRYGPYDELGAPDEPEVQDTRAQFAGVLLAYYLWRMPQGRLCGKKSSNGCLWTYASGNRSISGGKAPI